MWAFIRNVRSFACIAAVAIGIFGRQDFSWAAYPTLGNYTLASQFDALPNPDNNATNFSGIAYRTETQSLYIIDDQTTRIYEYTTAGAYMRRISLSNFADVEGIVFMGGNTFAVIEEGNKSITRLSITDSPANVTIAKSSGVTLTPNLAGDFGNSGLEDLAYDSANNTFYVVKEKTPASGSTVAKGVYQVDNPSGGGTATTSILSEVTATVSPLATDLSGIFFNNQSDGHLYVLSDESKLLMELTLNGTLIDSLVLPSSFSKPEGVTFSPDGHELFIVGENRELLHYHATPEPSTLLLVAIGGFMMLARGRKIRRVVGR